MQTDACLLCVPRKFGRRGLKDIDSTLWLVVRQNNSAWITRYVPRIRAHDLIIQTVCLAKTIDKPKTSLWCLKKDRVTKSIKNWNENIVYR